MSSHTEQALREALGFDPQTPSLQVESIIEAVDRSRRRSMWAGAAAASVALAAAGGIAVATLSDDVIEPVPAGVTEVSGTFEIGTGWEMVVDGQGLCLANEARTVYDCGVDVAFREGSTFSWSDGTSGPQIYAWVVRDSTATAALEKSQGGTISAQVYRVPDLDVSIAVAQLLPQDPAGWQRVSRDEADTVTDVVPFQAGDDSVPTRG
ncbi:hypothetical protein [Ornithinimicrobium cryptoxanthini]|uniref:Uncharacterized protein n=1 Tax=Ornithinimicrobium cryptoxanthini TaxID=2934161 RepID=A0ABY4YL73_9MICO|nr:hypothetical protein [Ornithinimicrobium cryptoxanthini]USQ77265.1 hypothetical protein NF557_04945 [Ornithinimicrobium cryptoxanthini]